MALVLIDASLGIVEGDITAVEVARKAHCATLIVLAKWDISTVTIEDVRPELQRRLRQRPDFITVSSLSGRGVSRLLGKVGELYDRYISRISTADLNKLIAELKELRQAPSKGQRRLNMLYGAQVATRPPRFRFTVNDPGLVTRDYGYWVENQLRDGSDSTACRSSSTSASGRSAGGRRRGGSVGDGVRAPAARARPRRVRRAARDDRRRTVRRSRPRRARRAEQFVPRGARPRAWHRAGALAREGARPRDRLASLDARARIVPLPCSRARTRRRRCCRACRERR